MEKDNWCVEIWGSRGSFPRPEEKFLKYGGNTSCVSLTYDGGIVILDAGSGLSGLGRRLETISELGHRKPPSVAEPGRGEPPSASESGTWASPPTFGRVDVLLSHLHLDHIQGLPAFRPFYDSKMEIHLYGQTGLKECLEMIVGPPYWPVEFRDFAARISFHELRPGAMFSLNGLRVSTMGGNHPGGSLLYRLDGVKKSLVYALDCEMDEKIFQSLGEFAKETDLLLWDAGFTAKDLKTGWGHSTWEQGMALRHLARAKKVVMMHYNGDYDDAFLQQLEETARKQDDAVLFAREGMRLC